MVCSWLADYLLTTNHLPATYQPSTNHLPTTYPPPTHHLPTTYPQPTHHLPTIYPPPTHHLPTTYPSLTNTTYQPLFYCVACSILPSMIMRMKIHFPLTLFQLLSFLVWSSSSSQYGAMLFTGWAVGPLCSCGQHTILSYP